jgi:PAS domain S-box-containing protein
MTDKATFERILKRERTARKEAERIMEVKSLELLKVNENLLELNTNLEKEIQERTQEIKKSADQLNILFNENPFPVIVYDRVTLKILDVNSTAIKKYHYDKIQFLQKTIHDLHPNHENKKLKSYFSKKKELTSSLSSNWQHVDANGELFDVVITGNSILYNEIPSRVAIIEDVTEKNRLLIEKDRQKKKYQDFIENSSDIIYSINSSGKFLYVNPSAVKFSGHSEEELLVMRFTDLIPEKFIQQVSNFYKFQMEQNLDSTYTEFPVLAKDGTEYWIGQNVESNELDENNEVVYNVTARNITDRKKLEKALLRSEEKYRSIIENMELGLLEVDVEGIITKAYPKFCDLTGYTAKELKGKKGDFLLDEEGLQIMKNETKNRVTEVSNVYELQIIRKNGERVWVLISAAPFYDEYNRIQGSVGIHLDITERKELEGDLVLAKTKAEDSLKSKDLFIANISHEIRTPLNAIIGITELLQSSINDHTLYEQLEHVTDAGKGLLTLINELLLVSKIDAEKFSLNPSSYSLTKCLEKNFELHKNRANEKSLSYSLNLDLPENDAYHFDYLKLGQVIQNLLSNSIKFTSKGSINLDAKLVSSSFNSDIISFRISDTGMGIPQENLKSIFKNFELANNNMNGEYGGTGLGLPIVEKILALLGSEIEVVSEKGNTTFEFYLKLSRLANNDRLPERKTNQEISLEGIHILVAEDNKANQFLIENNLKKLKATFHLVSNGLEAIEYLSSNSADIVLMDMRMPVVDGIEATKRIRRSKLHQNRPIIALTANADDKNKSICLANGMDDFLAKPYSIEDLFTRIKSCLGEPTIMKQNQIDLTSNDDEFQIKLTKIFIQESELRLIKLNEALLNQKYETIIGICHSMRPSLMHLGQDILYNLAKSIESGVKIESNTKTYIDQLEHLLKSLKKECLSE